MKLSPTSREIVEGAAPLASAHQGKVGAELLWLAEGRALNLLFALKV